MVCPVLSCVESVINKRGVSPTFFLLRYIDSCKKRWKILANFSERVHFSLSFFLLFFYRIDSSRKSKLKFHARSFWTAAPLLTLITRHNESRYNEINDRMVLQNDGGMLPSSTTYTGGLGSVVGSHGGHHVRRSLPDMGTAPSEPPKLYPYHLLVITNYRLPADVDRCNLEVSY